MFLVKYTYTLVFVILFSIVFSQHRSYNDKYEYRKKRHEVTLGVGASNCLTDLGGSFISDPNTEVSQIDFLRSVYDTDLAKSNFSVNAAYIYHFKRKINFRGNLAFAQIGADDAISKDLNRKNRNLNFKSSIVELSGIVEYYFAKPNYITEKSIASEIINLDISKTSHELENKIILLEHADPGYDWLFTRNPAGLITKYGGVASHMSIRCSEVGLPAAIGCGEIIYETLHNASKVLLDCKNHQIIVLEHKKHDEYIEQKKIYKSLGYIK